VLTKATHDLRAVTDAPRLEAECLLVHVCRTSRATLLAHPERALSAAEVINYQALVCRRVANYPLPYLIGHIEFYGLDFTVSPEVLIPRPETETLIDLALACRPQTIVDVGTGSGCIAVSLAVHLQKSTVHAIDISPAALAVARQNADKHGVSDQICLIAGDVLNPRPNPADLIISNPPYIPTGECATLPLSIRDYEPRCALDGGPNGLAIIQSLLFQAPAVLKPGGTLLIEIGADQGAAVTRLARTFFPNAEIHLHTDLAGRDRVLEIYQ
jgi:release factor glutamine methyltransferase